MPVGNTPTREKHWRRLHKNFIKKSKKNKQGIIGRKTKALPTNGQTHPLYEDAAFLEFCLGRLLF